MEQSIIHEAMYNSLVDDYIYISRVIYAMLCYIIITLNKNIKYIYDNKFTCI